MTSACAVADRLLGEPPRLVARRSLRRRRSGCGRSSCPRRSSRARYAASCSSPLRRMRSPCGDVERAAARARRAAPSAISFVRCGQARCAERSDGESSSVPSSRVAWEEYQRSGGCALRHARGVRSCNHAFCCIASMTPVSVTGASPAPRNGAGLAPVSLDGVELLQWALKCVNAT